MRLYGNFLSRAAVMVGLMNSFSACTKAETPVEPAIVKSIAYFYAHPQEAKTVTEKCKVLRDNELSTLSPTQLDAWFDTPPGINCQNASRAHWQFKNDAHQKAMRDEASKY